MQTNDVKTKRVHNLIIVDESGSKDLDWNAYCPGGGTPLYDAIGKAMFAREHRSRERYNCCVAEDAAMSVGSFFKEES